jgi:hypothetical protein
MNVLYWDLDVEPIKVSEGVMPAGPAGELSGYTVGPGIYTAEITYGENKQNQSFTVLPDPRDNVSSQVMEQKLSMVKSLYNEIDAIYRGLDNLQEVRKQIDQMTNRMPDDIEINEMGDEIMEKINGVENDLISPQQKTFQDIINYRNKLDLQLNNLMQTINGNTPPVTEGQKELMKELMDQWQGVETKLNGILTEDIGSFNQLLKDKNVQYIAPSEKKDKENEKSSS